jgi:drug/metabolite transporter (DMT)-like permease
MQAWIPLALLAPLLFAGMNFVDKYLIEKITEESPATVITILAGLAGIPFLIIFGLIAGPSVTTYGLANALGAISAGLLTIAGLYFYYKALVIADASLVAALFQLIVVFNYVLALIFLNEHLSLLQVGAIGIVVVGSVALSLESEEKRIKLNNGVFWHMLLASLLIAAADVVFKKIAKETSFLITQFYEYSSGVIAGVFLLVFHKSARRAFMAMIQKFRGIAFGASGFNEVLNLSSLVSMRYAMFLAPIAVVQAVMSLQSIYLIVLGVILTMLFPKYIRENLSKRHLLQKLLAVGIMLVGTTVLALAS